MSKSKCQTEKDIDFQRKKKVQRKQLLEQLQEEILEQEVEQAAWERELGLDS